jgi:hypothetical protein
MFCTRCRAQRALLLAFCLSLLLVGIAPAADSVDVRLIGVCDTHNAHGVAATEDYAYVADFDSGLRVISVADPAHPAEVGYYDTPHHAQGVAADENYAFVADGTAGLRVISVADPARPSEVGFCDTPGNASGVSVAVGYAYVADGTGGLRVISIADPANPTEVGSCNTPGIAMAVALGGGYAYVADRASGLRIISVADPANPLEVGFYETPYEAFGVAVSGPYVYVANYRDLRVVSVADPASPAEVGYYDSPGLALDVALSDGFIYLADMPAGLGIYQFFGGGVEETPNAEVRMTSVGPTVVRGVLVIPEAPNRKPQASSWLLDASGRTVAEFHAGANDVRWLAPGVYFVREATAQAEAVRKVVITR